MNRRGGGGEREGGRGSERESLFSLVLVMLFSWNFSVMDIGSFQMLAPDHEEDPIYRPACLAYKSKKPLRELGSTLVAPNWIEREREDRDLIKLINLASLPGNLISEMWYHKQHTCNQAN